MQRRLEFACIEKTRIKDPNSRLRANMVVCNKAGNLGMVPPSGILYMAAGCGECRCGGCVNAPRFAMHY
jgi:hypothetical protein